MRDEIKRVVLNGAGGGAPKAPFVAPGRPGDKAPPQAFDKSASSRMIEAAASEARIIEVLKKQPGMGVMALATATAAKKSTTAERLRRLRAKGLVEAAESGGWSAAGV